MKGDTTVEAPPSELDAASPNRLVLRWIFPEEAEGVMPVVHGDTLGRNPSATIVVNGEGVSRDHALIVREGAALTLRDVGSTNGTFLDGRRIVHAAIREGAVVRLGGLVGVFQMASSLQGASTGFGSVARDLWGGELLQRALMPARQAARSDLPVLLLGETGTGKELSARALHEWSGRPGPFLALNCGALPDGLAEAELFGFRRGAFTGALKDSAGLFRSAHRGTLLLDEIAELPPALQTKLLRVLQERSITPLGQYAPEPVDVRLIAASPPSLPAAVAAGRFRADLFMRLKGLIITLPTLRARSVDVPRLLFTFLRRAAGGGVPRVDAKLIEALCLYPWPGNVRELELVARQLVAVHGHEGTLKRRHLPPEVLAASAGADEATGELPRDRAGAELDRLAATLERNGGNMRRACVELELSRGRAYRLLKGRSVEEFLAEWRASRAGSRR
jgi:transcriptional regulator of acetoin/glycerol metabolism